MRRPRESPCDKAQAKSWLGASSCAWSGTRRNSRRTRHAADLMLGIPTAQLTLDRNDDGCRCYRLHTCDIVISPSLRLHSSYIVFLPSCISSTVGSLQSEVALDDAPPVDCRTAGLQHGITAARKQESAPPRSECASHQGSLLVTLSLSCSQQQTGRQTFWTVGVLRPF